MQNPIQVGQSAPQPYSEPIFQPLGSESREKKPLGPNERWQKIGDKWQVVREVDALSDFVFGKVQPQALELEEAVLGALMIDCDAFDVVSEILRPESFYTQGHQAIFRACLSLRANFAPVDMLTVTESLRKSGELEKAGGSFYIVELTNRVASAANIEYHARIVAQKHIQREIIRACMRSMKDAYEDTTDVLELLETHQKSAYEIGAMSMRGGRMRDIGTAANAAFEKVRRAMDLAALHGEQVLTGLQTGIKDLDAETGGWQNGQLIIIGARASMGKTSFMLGSALAEVKDGKKVAVFSLEMKSDEIAMRLTSMISNISMHRINTARLTAHEFEEFTKAINTVATLAITIDDSMQTATEICAKIRKLHREGKCDIAFVDHLGHMKSESKNQRFDLEIGERTKSLKASAKECDVPIVCLAQLNRAVETRGGSKRPQLSDLRDSGNIEQDADLVGFLYRPEYYQILEDEQGQSLKGIGEFIIAKHRNGALGTVKMRWNGECVRYENIETLEFAAMPDPQNFAPSSGRDQVEGGGAIPF